MIVNWMMMHYFHFDDQGNIRYFMDRSKVGITYHKRGFKEAKNNALRNIYMILYSNVL